MRGNILASFTRSAETKRDDLSLARQETKPSLELLRGLNGLRELDRSQLTALAERLEILHAKKGSRLIELGSPEPTVFYLLQGDLFLTAEDGGRSKLKHTDTSAHNPVARLRPSRYDVSAGTNVSFLKIEADVLEEFLGQSQMTSSMLHAYDVEFDDPDSEEGIEDALSFQLFSDLEHDRLPLPSVPDRALMVARAVEHVKDSTDYLAQVLLADPAMSAKIVRAAATLGKGSVTSVQRAVSMLGPDQVTELVLRYSIQELFRSGSGQLQRYMATVLKHSLRVGFIAKVLSERSGMFDPDTAQLAGLTHDIGILAILYYAQDMPELTLDASILDHAIRTLRGRFGKAILSHWQFPVDLVMVPPDSEDWLRDPGPEPDYADLVLVARLHSYFGTKRMASLPPLSEVPAFAKLELGEASPHLSLSILEEAVESMRAQDRLVRENRA